MCFWEITVSVMGVYNTYSFRLKYQYWCDSGGRWCIKTDPLHFTCIKAEHIKMYNPLIATFGFLFLQFWVKFEDFSISPCSEKNSGQRGNGWESVGCHATVYRCVYFVVGNVHLGCEVWNGCDTDWWVASVTQGHLCSGTYSCTEHSCVVTVKWGTFSACIPLHPPTLFVVVVCVVFFIQAARHFRIIWSFKWSCLELQKECSLGCTNTLMIPYWE